MKNNYINLLLDEVTIFRDILNKDEDGSRPLREEVKSKYKHEIASRMDEVNILLNSNYSKYKKKPTFN